MNVIFHYPETQEGMDNLSLAVSKVHSEFVINYLNKKPYLNADKEKIISEIISKKYL